LKGEAYKRLKKSLSKEYGGLTGAHRILLLEEGMKWQQTTIDPEKAQFLELRRFQVTEAARILKMPPHKVGDLERETFANIESQGIDYLVHTLRPWLVNWEQRLRLSLLSKEQKSNRLIEFVVDGLLRGDSEARAAFYKALFNMASISPNEIRANEGMNPYDGGDRRYIQLNLIDVTSEPEPFNVEAMRWLFERMEKRNGHELPVREVKAIETRQRPRIRQRLRRAFVRVFRDAMQRVTKTEISQVREAMGAFLGERSTGEFKDWLDDYYGEEYVALLERVILPTQMTYALSMAETVAEEVSAEFDEAEIQKFVRDYHDVFAARRSGSSLGQLQKLVDETDEELEGMLDQRLAEWDEKNSAKVGRWEAHRLGGAIATSVMVGAGVTRFVWRASPDPCPICAELDGKVVGVGEPFMAEGDKIDNDQLSAPFQASSNVLHEPLHDGCDCMVIAE
jgi:hypothetical protein